MTVLCAQQHIISTSAQTVALPIFLDPDASLVRLAERNLRDDSHKFLPILLILMSDGKCKQDRIQKCPGACL